LVNLSKKTVTDISGLQKAYFTNVGFSPINELLIVMYEVNKFVVWDCYKNKVHSWSVKGGGKFPIDLRKEHCKINSVVFREGNKNRLLFKTNYSLVLVDLKSSVPKKFRKLGAKAFEGSSQRKEIQADDEDSSIVKNFDVLTRKRPVLGVWSIAADKYLLLEFDWNTVLRSIPDPVISKKYGV